MTWFSISSSNATRYVADVSIGSTVAANSMLFQEKKENCLENREVLLCAMMNATPAYFRELFTYQIPVVLPALGLVVGRFYSIVFVVTAVFKILLIAIFGTQLGLQIVIYSTAISVFVRLAILLVLLSIAP